MSSIMFHWTPFPAATEGHTHEFAHIIVPLAGDVLVSLGGTDYLMTTNHLFFIPPNVHHFCHRSNTVLVMDIPCSMIKTQDLEVLSQCLFVPLGKQIQTIVHLIRQELIDNTDDDSIRYLYFYLYSKLMTQYHHKSVRYIHDHFAEPLTIQMLANLESYNITYFTDWFKKQTGVTPSHYIRGIRMDKARELLLTTDYRVIDIAVQVGYSDNPAFSRAFKEVFHCSPASYRKNMQLAIAQSHLSRSGVEETVETV